ncbi:DUF2505 domain-containing protein [Sorangium sp. So ce1099]|uniref:DUF2505 domain-containing protein n=1 Tax=Sorangium sp. So ce1099 TaxID=3133331 RepID=UPI003F645DE9
MGRFTVTHEINAGEEAFWTMFFDRSFNEKLYREILGFPAFEILEQNENDAQITRKVSGTPKMEVPGPLAKLIGPGFGYIEEGRFDKKSKSWSWKTIPSSLADKVRNEGVLRVEPVGSDKVRRIAQIDIEAKIFGVGGLIESTVEKQLRQGWGESAVFMNKYLAGAR